MYQDQAFQPGLNQLDAPAVPSYPTVTEPLLLATAQPTVKLGSSTLILVPFGLVALWTIALVCFKQQAKRQNRERCRTQGRLPLNQLPCRRCVFFKNNPYLKCAINPLDALTTKAIDCTDYTPHSLPQHKR